MRRWYFPNNLCTCVCFSHFGLSSEDLGGGATVHICKGSEDLTLTIVTRYICRTFWGTCDTEVLTALCLQSVWVSLTVFSKCYSVKILKIKIICPK